MRRILVVLLCVMGVALSAIGVSAQEMETIPFESRANPLVLSPDDRTLAVYHNGIIYGIPPTADLMPIWLVDIETGETIGSLKGATDWVTDVAFNSDGSRLVSFQRNGDMLLWDVAEQKLIKTIQTFTLGGGWVQFLSDDKTVVYRAGEFIAGLLDTESGAITRLFGRHLESMDEFQERFAQIPGRTSLTFNGAAVSPDDRWLVTSTGNDEILLWDLDGEGGAPRTLRPESEQAANFGIRGLTFLNDGMLVYHDHEDEGVHVWDVAVGEEPRSYAPLTSEYALAQDGVTVAWADRDTNAIYLADMTNDDEPVKLLDVPESLQIAPNITTLAFTSDGAQLVVGGFFARDEQNEIYVIEVAS
jgi:WD40 repeat protein